MGAPLPSSVCARILRALFFPTSTEMFRDPIVFPPMGALYWASQDRRST